MDATSDGRAGLGGMQFRRFISYGCGAALSILAGCTDPNGPADDVAPPRVFDVGALPSNLQSGDLVHSGALSAVVPPAGYSVSAQTLHTDGHEDRLTLRTAPDGRVDVLGPQAAATADVADTTAPDACTDRQYKLLGYTWGSTGFDYRFNPSNIPDWEPLTLDYVTSQIVAGAHNVAQERNDCGRPDHISAHTNYLGHTSKHPNLGANDLCGNPDGESVVGFGTFDDDSILAATCTWSVFGVPYLIAYESDVRVSSDQVWLWQDNQECQPLAGEYYYSLEAVLTHERGHTFGLDDLVSPSHHNLTMYGSSNPCETRKRTLGLGDMLGLEALY